MLFACSQDQRSLCIVDRKEYELRACILRLLKLYGEVCLVVSSKRLC